MKRRFSAIIGSIFLAMFVLAVPAQADHAEASWSGNGDSHVVNETTVHLEGGTDLGTSVETTALGITVDKGDEVSFQYELAGRATCAGGAPRVFLVVNGASASANNSWDGNSDQCGDADEVVTFQVDRSGGITAAGIVYDNVPVGEDQVVGSIEVSNLTIDGEVVHFMNPEPENPVVEKPESKPATCDGPGYLVFPDAPEDFVVWRVEGEDYSGKEPSDPGEYVVDAVSVGDNPPPVNSEGGEPTWKLTIEEADGCEEPSPTPTPTETSSPDPSPTPVPTEIPAGTDTLPKTGVGSDMLAGISAGLILLGVGLIATYRKFRSQN